MTAFASAQSAAQALLNAALAGSIALREKEGQFLGGLSFRQEAGLSDKQINWLAILLQRNGLPPLEGGAP